LIIRQTPAALQSRGISLIIADERALTQTVTATGNRLLWDPSAADIQ